MEVYPIKVVYIQQDGQITGSAISLLNLIQGFPSGLVIPVVLFLKNGPAIEYFEKEGFETKLVRGFGFWTTPGPFWFQRDNLENLLALLPNFGLRKAIKDIDPHVVHINDKAALNAGISIFGMGKPIVQHLRSTRYICRTPLYHYVSMFLIELYASSVIAISEDEADGFRKKKLRIIFNSLDIRGLVNSIEVPHEKVNSILKVGWVGRFTRAKGAYDFLEVAGEIKKSYANVEFHMLAPLPNENEFEFLAGGTKVLKRKYIDDLILRYGLENNVILHGYRKDYLTVMASLDLIINCNRLGALSRQSFESLCLGVPTIATAKFPGRSSIIPKEVGIVLEEGSIDSIANSAIAIIKDNNKRKRMAENAKNWGKLQFDREIQSLKVLDVYKKLIF